MFTPFIRIILVIICLVVSIWFYFLGNFTYAGLMLFAAGLFIYGYFKYGTVFIAFQQLKKENFAKAERLISKINTPNNLSKKQKSYYHLTKGLIEFKKNKLDVAKSELNKALKIGLGSKNDTSILLLYLAIVEYELRNLSSANEYIKKLKNFDLKPLIKSEMDKLIEKINSLQKNV